MASVGAKLPLELKENENLQFFAIKIVHIRYRASHRASDKTLIRVDLEKFDTWFSLAIMTKKPNNDGNR